MRNFVEVGNEAFKNTADTYTRNIRNPVSRVDFSIVGSVTAASGATLSIDGDKSLIANYLGTVSIYGRNGRTIAEMPANLCWIASAIMLGQMPQDSIRISAASADNTAYFESLIPLPVFQHVENVKIAGIAGAFTDGNLVTDSGGTVQTPTITVSTVAVDMNSQYEMPPLFYQYQTLSLGTTFNERYNLIGRKVYGLILVPTNDYITECKLYDGTKILTTTTQYKYADFVQKFESDFENYLGEKKYDAGTAILEYNRIKRPDGVVFHKLNGYTFENELQLVGTCSSAETCNIIAILMD